MCTSAASSTASAAPASGPPVIEDVTRLGNFDFAGTYDGDLVKTFDGNAASYWSDMEFATDNWGGLTPEVPLGIADVQVAYQRVVEDLARLDVPLKRADGNDRLKTLPIKSLVRLMSGLAADSEVMENLQERTALIQELREKGLNPLITDLSVRHVPESRVADELELAWWQSVLEHVGGRGRSGGETAFGEDVRQAAGRRVRRPIVQWLVCRWRHDNRGMAGQGQ